MTTADLGAGALATKPSVSASRPRLMGLFRGDASELLSKVFVGALFLALVIRITADFLATGRITGLFVIVSEGLVVVFTVLRRPAIAVDRTTAARLATALSLCGPLLLRPTGAPGSIGDASGATMSVIGLMVIVAGKMTLGRSFGLVPANRGVVCSGVYRLVRHPIYVGYLVTHTAYFLAQPSIWNALVLVAGDGALLIRAIYEERTLSRDPAYAAYMTRVRWRILPCVF